MNTVGNIDELAELVSNFPERFKDETDSLRSDFRDAIVSFFDERLKETGGVITTDVRVIVDRLYDLPGTPRILADALGLGGIFEVRKLLARKRIVQCIGCSDDIEIPWGELASVAQALWRLDPSSYFAFFHPPLLKMPLVLLCQSCASKLDVLEFYQQIIFD